MLINLNQYEYQYLITANFIDKSILQILSKFHNKAGIFHVDLEDKLADYLREQLADRLQVAGFDNNYELTKEGFILECLIDKLFTG